MTLVTLKLQYSFIPVVFTSSFNLHCQVRSTLHLLNPKQYNNQKRTEKTKEESYLYKLVTFDNCLME